MLRRGSGRGRGSVALLVVLGLLVAAVLVGSAAGDPGSVYTIRGGGDLDWQPASGTFGPSSSSDPTSAFGSLSDGNGTAAYTIAAGPGIARATIAGTFTSSGGATERFNPSVQASATTELTVSGPASVASLNLHVDSTFNVTGCPDVCTIGVGIGGPGGFTRFGIQSGFTENTFGLTADPIPGGYHLHGDVTTPQFGLSVPGTPTPISISLQINVNNLSRGVPGEAIFDVGPSTVSFAPSGPVLNVPSGNTVSGPGVVDNQWTDPFVPDIELRFDDGTPMPGNAELDLGEVASGSVAEGGYRIANTGSAQLEITGVAAEPISSTGTAEAPVPASPSVDPGSATPAVVRCGGTNPSVVEPRSVSFDVRISSNDPDESPSYFRVRCTLLPEPPGRPVIELRLADGTPMPPDRELDVGDVASGSVVEGSYRIANIGDGRLEITDIDVLPFGVGVAEAPPPTNPSIDPGDSTSALVRCGGTNTGPDARNFRFEVTVLSVGDLLLRESFVVRCTVLPEPVPTPDIELRLQDGSAMPAVNPTIDLGDVPSGVVKPGAYRIANVGDATLEVTSITHDTPAVGIALAPSLTASISPGGSSLAQLGCGGGNPDTTPRNVEFTVSVHSNDPDESSAQFTVRCRLLVAPIVPPTVNPPDIELRFADGTPMANPAVLDLGDVASGEVKNQDFEIGNVGDVTLVISDYVADPASGDIHPAGIDATSVLAHGRTVAHVSCQGVNTGSTPSVRTATFGIVSNDPDESTLSLTVVCRILPEPRPDIELRLDSGTPMPNVDLDLGDVASGESTVGHFRVANVGNGTLHIVLIDAGPGSWPAGIEDADLLINVVPAGQDVRGSVECGGTNTTDDPHGNHFVVSISSDDPDEVEVRFAVVCRILPEPRPDIELRLDSGTPMPNVDLDLGDVASGESTVGHFRVANVGNGTLHIVLIDAGPGSWPAGIEDADLLINVVPAGQDVRGSVECGGTNTTDDPHGNHFVVSISSDDPDEVEVRFAVVCRILPEATTPPTIIATATPGPNANGWNNTDVTVSYTCTDAGSGVNQAASSLGDDVLTASGAATGTCVDNAGNSANASYTAQIDKVGPTVSYSSHPNTYSVMDTVSITCTAVDAMSGVASSTCADTNSPAWSFGAGAHPLSANATDRAGNTGSGSTTFTVIVKPAGLTNLTKQFVQSSAKYQALKPAQKAAVNAIVTVATNFLLNIGPSTAPALKAQFINAYKAAVTALVAPGWLTANQAATLKTLANSI